MDHRSGWPGSALVGLVDFGGATGSVCCIGSAVSTVIRKVLGRNDLFLLDYDELIAKDDCFADLLRRQQPDQSA